MKPILCSFHARRRAIRGAAIVAVLGVQSLAALAAPRTTVERVASRPDVTQGYFLIEPEQTPRAIAVVFVGGDGETALGEKGPAKLRGNFLMRVRGQLSAAGLILAYPDVPSDRQGRGLGDFRTGANHAQDIGAVIQALKSRHDLPAFVIGTSRGTISAANVAARLPPGTIAGVVLTSTVTERSKNKQRGVMDLPLGKITAPVFALAHKGDTCYVTPPSAIPGMLRAMSASPRKDSMLLSGGKPAKSDPCEAFAEHGFFGIEHEAAKAMTDWIDSVLVGK
jgi:pimeloyl-ACP methyl ester carboxylesterase